MCVLHCTARLGKCDSMDPWDPTQTQCICKYWSRTCRYVLAGTWAMAGDPSMAIIKQVRLPPNLGERSPLLAWHFATCRAHARRRSHGPFLQFRKAHGDRHEIQLVFTFLSQMCNGPRWRWFKNRVEEIHSAIKLQI